MLRKQWDYGPFVLLNYKLMQSNPYSKFGLMLFISFLVMYAVMFLNVDKADHIYLSITRVYMTILMVAPMSLIMLLLMKHMYQNKKANRIIMIVSVVAVFLAFAGLRSQSLVGDVQYMKAMIPHHSSAIMTSSNAGIKDPEVRELADSIIASQRREIAQMKAILKRMDQ